MEAPSEEDKEEIMGVSIGDPLTRRQAEVLEYIRRQTRENGRPPTVREIGRGVGIKHSNGVTSFLTPLRRKGYIAPNDGTSRSIRLLAGDGSLLCPHCGQPIPRGKLEPSSN
jgi:SOS-response transcriptional repressor LexA